MPLEFENWAVKQLNGRANKVQIGDMGIDGRIYPVGVQPRESGAGELQLSETWYLALHRFGGQRWGDA